MIIIILVNYYVLSYINGVKECRENISDNGIEVGVRLHWLKVSINTTENTFREKDFAIPKRQIPTLGGHGFHSKKT